MGDHDEHRQHLTVIAGGRSRQVSFGEIRVVAGPVGRAPFAVDGIVFEEDTFLVMSSEAGNFGEEEYIVEIMTHALEALPVKPGSVLVKGRKPVRLLAVIHDFDQEPSCREEWVRAAIRNALLVADKYQLKTIAMPVLGTVHHSLHIDRALELLAGVLKRLPLTHLQRIWLLVSEAERMQVLDRLEASVG